jgi:hypothetical protein
VGQLLSEYEHEPEDEVASVGALTERMLTRLRSASCSVLRLASAAAEHFALQS